MNSFNCVLQGDCARVLKTLPDCCVDLVVTDPPYFVRYRDRSGRSIANDVNPDSVLGAFTDLYRVLKPNTFCVSFYGWNSVAAFADAWRRAGFRMVGHIVWKKEYASKVGFLRAIHEQAYVLVKGHPDKPTQPIDDVRRWLYTGNRLHPTEKHVEVLRPLIEAFSKPADVVLDPFAGSGSTLVAAQRAGRQFLGIEWEARYCELIRRRLGLGAASALEPARGGPDDPGDEQALRGLWSWLSDHRHEDLAQVVRQVLTARSA